MGTMEMISKAFKAVVKQKVAEKTESIKTLESLQEKLDFIKTFNDDEITSVFNFLKNNNETFQDLLDIEYQNRLDDDDKMTIMWLTKISSMLIWLMIVDCLKIVLNAILIAQMICVK